jgi:hypothetical protein
MDFDRFPPHSQFTKQNKTLHDELSAFQAREPAMSKRISDLRRQIDDMTHLEQRVDSSDHAARQRISLPEIKTDVRDPSASSPATNNRIVRIADSNSQIRELCFE